MAVILCKKTGIALAESLEGGECMCPSKDACLVFPDEADVVKEKGDDVEEKK